MKPGKIGLFIVNFFLILFLQCNQYYLGYFVDQMVPCSWLWLCCGFYCWQWELWRYLPLCIQLLLECESLQVFKDLSFSCSSLRNIIFIIVALLWTPDNSFSCHCISYGLDFAVYWGSSPTCWLWYCGQVDTEEQCRVWKYELVWNMRTTSRTILL
jgi:hypothetical protein